MSDQETLDFVFNNCPCLNLRKSVRTTSRFFEEALSPYDINVSKLILIISIARSPGISQKELSEILNLQQSSLSRSIQEVLKLDWIKKEENKSGTKKIISLFITPDGLKKIKEVAPIWVQSYQEFLKKISQENWGQTLDFLKEINFD